MGDLAMAVLLIAAVAFGLVLAFLVLVTLFNRYVRW